MSNSIRFLYSTLPSVLLAFSSAQLLTPSSALGNELCDDALVALELHGVRGISDPITRDLQQRLDRYLNVEATPLYTRSNIPFGRTQVTAVLFSGRVNQNFCQRSPNLVSLRVQIERELEHFPRVHSTLFNHLSIKVHLLSQSAVVRQHPCQENYFVYRLEYVRPNPYLSATDLPPGCLRTGTLVGSEAFDTQSGLHMSILNPFTARPNWCRTLEDQEAEAQRIRQSCPSIASVRLLPQSLSASRIAEHLGLGEY
jgi:hypothetical protein